MSIRGAQLTGSDRAPKLTPRVEFRAEMQDKVRQNTTHCPWPTGILARTHPRAYAALLTEAHAAGVQVAAPATASVAGLR